MSTVITNETSRRGKTGLIINIDKMPKIDLPKRQSTSEETGTTYDTTFPSIVPSNTSPQAINNQIDDMTNNVNPKLAEFIKLTRSKSASLFVEETAAPCTKSLEDSSPLPERSRFVISM